MSMSIPPPKRSTDGKPAGGAAAAHGARIDARVGWESGLRGHEPRQFLELVHQLYFVADKEGEAGMRCGRRVAEERKHMNVPCHNPGVQRQAQLATHGEGAKMQRRRAW